ncbi:hypothetical protein [Pedobacter immunditicola]|uniref:hypothetical protein n=1 Tax=Pedobacter immunditicola TaxID=3133440 RepID=UPI00309A0119
MSKSDLKTSLILTIILTTLSVIAAAGGLLLNNLYGDNDFVKSAWSANDTVTLFVVVPLLLFSMILTEKGYHRWLFIWIGLVGYIFYNFAFYLFGAVFNKFFLIYAALFSLSAITLISMLSKLNIQQLAGKFSNRVPVRFVSFYLLLIAAILLMVEMSMIIPFITSGRIPETIKLTEHPTSIVFALDLTIILPLSILAAILLWRRRAWGYVWAIIMLVKGFTYGLVLCIGTIKLANAKTYGHLDPLMPFYAFLTIGGIFCCWLIMKSPEQKNLSS